MPFHNILFLFAVIHLLKYEPEFLIYWFWLGTVIGVCGGLLFSALGAVFAAINTATSTSRCLTSSLGLYLWNVLGLVADVVAIGFWIAQFYLRVQYNVLSREDRDNDWTSKDMAELGYSFWFVVGAAVASFVNIIIIFIANSEKEVDTVVPVLEEKTNGAIMLY
jgi:magnesium-transporting ATPase (P-type)